MTIEITEKKDEEAKPQGIKDIVKDIDELNRLKEQNDAFETEIKRTEELRSRLSLSGRALAGRPNEKTSEEEAKEEASRILGMFK